MIVGVLGEEGSGCLVLVTGGGVSWVERCLILAAGVLGKAHGRMLVVLVSKVLPVLDDCVVLISVSAVPGVAVDAVDASPTCNDSSGALAVMNVESSLSSSTFISRKLRETERDSRLLELSRVDTDEVCELESRCTEEPLEGGESRMGPHEAKGKETLASNIDKAVTWCFCLVKGRSDVPTDTGTVCHCAALEIGTGAIHSEGDLNAR